MTSPYQQVLDMDTAESEGTSLPANNVLPPATDVDHEPNMNDTVVHSARKTLWNFVLMSVLFSANHGCVVACLALATSRLGSTGAWQSGILYIAYTASAVLGATFVVKRFGARNSLWLGMTFYCAYVACFYLAVALPYPKVYAYTGAFIGGVGAGFLWTAQGSYFGLAAEEHAMLLQQPVEQSTASFAGIFAFLYLAEEVVLRLLSTVLLEAEVASWEMIFGIYTAVAVMSTIALPLIRNYPASGANESDGNSTTTTSIFYKVTAAGQLLWKDPKMKYMIGMNAAFGFAAAFLNSYVNGQVVPAQYIGVLGSWVPIVAAVMSLVFGRVTPIFGKGPILILGACCFFGVAFPFVVQPDTEKYGWAPLLLVYSLHGIGRATFEGTLKATFADYFPYEKEGAFANIILQNGLSGAIGYILTFSLLCDVPSRYCIEYKDGSLHDVLTFELIVVISALAAIFGYLRASGLHQQEEQESGPNYEIIGSAEGGHSVDEEESNVGPEDSTAQTQGFVDQPVTPPPNDSL